MTVYTPESVLSSLGYADPFDAARQYARMILLGRLARYQAEIQTLESRWGYSFNQMQEDYTTLGKEDFAQDDDYLQWRWLIEAIETIQQQLVAVTGR